MISQTYDTDADALYIGIEKGDTARTVQVDAGTLVDLDASGEVLGIEVIQPHREWPLHEILQKFIISHNDAYELRAYFPMPPHPSLPPEPVDAGLRVALSA